MNINKLYLVNGASKATGLTVVIDVFRAFSVECYLFANGATRIYPVASIDEAYLLKEKNPHYILMGERYEKICEGFDFGNSPTHIKNVDFTGKTIVHTTSSGTQGIALAKNSSEIITGAFVNANAIARYIQQSNINEISLVAMGYEGKRNTQEDDFCADYIEGVLLNNIPDFNNMVDIIRTGDGARLLDPKNNKHSPAFDFDLCLNINAFDFVLRVKKDKDGWNYLEKVSI